MYNPTENDIAISVRDLSKTFRIPHVRYQTAREGLVNFWRKQTYEEFHALNGVTFDVRKGEFFGVIGRNGSGKSTLLRILAGIYVPDSGKVVVRGSVSPFLGLGVGFNPLLSARENVFLNGAVLGLSKKMISKKFDEIISFAELWDFIDTKVRNFSSGMTMRLAFSIAIHANKDLILLDEVLAVGDAGFQVKCRQVFKNLRSEGRTFVFVTHDLGTVRELCTNVVVLHKGKIVTTGTAETAIAAYQNLLV